MLVRVYFIYKVIYEGGYYSRSNKKHKLSTNLMSFHATLPAWPHTAETMAYDVRYNLLHFKQIIK